MSKIHLPLILGLSAAALLLGSTAIASPPVAMLKQPGKWAQDYTHRAPDPAVRFGTLPNGMRYAIMHNDYPKDGVSMRLRFGSGSIEERDEEQGLAHFLEHMAFRGSANLADGEVVHMLERQGLRFGPDTNAFTAQDQTVYMYDFPHANAEALGTGLKLFRELGGRLTLAPAAGEAEKGVVLSEERLRDTPQYRSVKANFGTSLAGTRAVTRWPIGTVDTIRAATPARLRRFYEANYRPENATLLIVGSIDPVAIERAVKTQFGDWRGTGPADKVDPGTPINPAHPVAQFVAAGAPDQLSVNWVRPPDRRADTEAVEKEGLLRLLGLTVLNHRLSDRAQSADAPFVGAQAASQSLILGSAGMTLVGISTVPDKWQVALNAALEEQRRIVRDGVQASELQRAATELRTFFRNQMAGAATRTNATIINGLLQTVGEDSVYTSPAQDLAQVTPILSSATVEQVNAALRGAFTGNGPTLFRSAQSGSIETTALEAGLAEALAKPVGAAQQQAAITWPYASFGAPGAVSSRTTDAALGTTSVTFANGARLTIKPTSLAKNEILVDAALGNGRRGVAPALTHALWTVTLVPTFPLGGLGKLSVPELERFTQSSGRIVSANLQTGNGAFHLTGKTIPADLALEMQLLAAYARDPGFRATAFERTRALGPMVMGQIGANAQAVFGRALGQLTTGNDPRFAALPTPADVSATTAEDLPAMLHGPLSQAADVTIVGDVRIDDAIAAAAATFGAVSAARTDAPKAERITMVPGRAEPYIVEHGGRADQAMIGQFWGNGDYFDDPDGADALDVASAILSARLVDTVREKLGMTYSPQTSAIQQIDLPGNGYFGAVIETPPANFDKFRALLAEQITSLATNPITADELERARKPIIESRRKEFENNGFWLNHLRLIQRDPRIKQPTLEGPARIARVTAADVQAALRRYIVGKTPVTLISRARATP